MTMKTKLRTLWTLIKILYATLIHPVMLLVYIWFDRFQDFKLFFKCGPLWTQGILRAANITLKIEGMEKLDPNTGYILVANHTSLFDIPAIWATERRCLFIYRKSLQKVPILGWAIGVSPAVGIDRDSKKRDNSHNIEKAAALMGPNDDTVVFAEGTRSRSGKLGPFKRGAFLIATKSGKQIVPVSVIGARDIMAPDSLEFRPGVIRVVFGDPISPPPLNTRDEEKEFMEFVRSKVAEPLPDSMK